MPEIKSLDHVFFVKEINQNIGIRVYYESDPQKCTIRYDGQSKEFGVGSIEYEDNPKKGYTTTYSYEFKVVAGKPYQREDGGSREACMDIRIDALQNTRIKKHDMCEQRLEFLDDGGEHTATVSTKCD